MRSKFAKAASYVDGETLYVRGRGLLPHGAPHQHSGHHPYAGTNHRAKMDFERMKAAHFNTIRTWDALEPEDLALAN